MKRDMKLIDHLLAYVEKRGKGIALERPEVPNYTAEQVQYHINLCYEAGFIHVCQVGNMDGGLPLYDMLSLTWEGHNRLEGLDNSG